MAEYTQISLLVGDLPNSLPGYLIFYCGNPRFWIYADKRCDKMNDCGDCSDETGTCKFLLYKAYELYFCDT